MIYAQPVNTKEKHYLYHGTPDKMFIPESFDPAQCVLGLWLTDDIGTTLSYRTHNDDDEDEVPACFIGGITAADVMQKFENLSCSKEYGCSRELRRHFTDIASLAESLEIHWSLEKVIRHVTEEEPEKQKALNHILSQGVVFPGRTLIVEVDGSLDTSWALSSEDFQKEIHVGVKEPNTRHAGSFNYNVYDFSRVHIVGEVL